MSAVAAAVWDAGVVVAADGVSTDPDTGAVAGHCSKLLLYPARNAIIAWTGIGNFGHVLDLVMCGEPDSFDGLVQAFPLLCRVAWLRLMADGLMNEPESMHEVSVVLAGFSDERNAYEGYRVVSYPKESRLSLDADPIKVEPWQMVPIGYAFSSHSNVIEEGDPFGLGDPTNQTDPIGLCTRFICAARRDSGLMEEGGRNGEPRHYNAGGFVQVAYLQRDHLQSWIAHRWPDDVVGRPVDATKGEPMPAYLMTKEGADAAHDTATA